MNCPADAQGSVGTKRLKRRSVTNPKLRTECSAAELFDELAVVTLGAT